MGNSGFRLFLNWREASLNQGREGEEPCCEEITL